MTGEQAGTAPLVAPASLFHVASSFRWSDAKGGEVIVNAEIGTITRFCIEARATLLAPAED